MQSPNFNNMIMCCWSLRDPSNVCVSLLCFCYFYATQVTNIDTNFAHRLYQCKELMHTTSLLTVPILRPLNSYSWQWSLAPVYTKAQKLLLPLRSFYCHHFEGNMFLLHPQSMFCYKSFHILIVFLSKWCRNMLPRLLFLWIFTSSTLRPTNSSWGL